MIRGLLYCVSLVFLLYTQGVYAVLVDPTQPPDHADKQGLKQEKFELTGIVTSSDHKIAIINGQVVKIGDKIMGSQVTVIEDTYVQLYGPHGNVTLYINGAPVKKEINNRS